MRAWQAVTPLVQQLREFYEFSTQLEESVVHLLTALTSTDMSPSQHLESQQALTKQFAEILHFTLSFDDLKVSSSCVRTRAHTHTHTHNTHTQHTTHTHTHTCMVCEVQHVLLVNSEQGVLNDVTESGCY